jgi:hypothetical protein
MWDEIATYISGSKQMWDEMAVYVSATNHKWDEMAGYRSAIKQMDWFNLILCMKLDTVQDNSGISEKE